MAEISTPTSVVALDISGAAPRLKWYYKIVPNDVHDNDPSMPPVLFTGNVNGAESPAIGRWR